MITCDFETCNVEYLYFTFHMDLTSNRMSFENILCEIFVFHIWSHLITYDFGTCYVNDHAFISVKYKMALELVVSEGDKMS